MSSEIRMDKIKEMLEESATVKGFLRNGLKEIKVPASMETAPDVINAVIAIFGEDNIKDGRTHITFDMVARCLELLRVAGKQKALELIR